MIGCRLPLLLRRATGISASQSGVQLGLTLWELLRMGGPLALASARLPALVPTAVLWFRYLRRSTLLLYMTPVNLAESMHASTWTISLGES